MSKPSLALMEVCVYCNVRHNVREIILNYELCEFTIAVTWGDLLQGDDHSLYIGGLIFGPGFPGHENAALKNKQFNGCIHSVNIGGSSIAMSVAIDSGKSLRNNQNLQFGGEKYEEHKYSL
jgi:hypothetical protein